MDKLEEHIRKNREALDRYSPSANVWRNVNRRLRPEKYPFKRWVSIAALFIVILATAVILKKTDRFPGGTLISGNNVEKSTSDNSQLKEAEIYYNNLVNSLYREATPMLTGNPEIQKELTNDISHLDSMCIDIKRDLKDNVANQDVMEALIQNYRLKIRLLEDMLTILKENENNLVNKKSYEL